MNPPILGVTAVEMAVIGALDQIGANSRSPTIKTARVLDLVDQGGLASPRHAYDVLCLLSQPSRVHVPLFEGRGNFGTLDDPPRTPGTTR